MKKTFQVKGISIIGISEDANAPMFFGVTKFGGTPGERFNKSLGLEIAERRANIQPFTSIEKYTPSRFTTVVETIVNHLNYQKQTSLKNLKRT